MQTTNDIGTRWIVSYTDVGTGSYKAEVYTDNTRLSLRICYLKRSGAVDIVVFKHTKETEQYAF